MLDLKSSMEALNGICPYFTMFPLAFPLQILSQFARKNDIVLDPFCGRWTTNFAARLLGLSSVGIDISPVAIAITEAKLVATTPKEIMAEAKRILKEQTPKQVPSSEFWQLAFHSEVLRVLCQFREAFLTDCSTPARKALRGLILGALHGPKQKNPSYFSNQCLRTYAPKPKYAVRFWRERNLAPEPVDVLAIIKKRAERYFNSMNKIKAKAYLADSRYLDFQSLFFGKKFNWIITSPPYYGMTTYLSDQWLRNWFVGGLDDVDYSQIGQIARATIDNFVENLRLVWQNLAAAAAPNAVMVIRFGALPAKKIEPLSIIKQSLKNTGWSIIFVKQAGSALKGRRQAYSFKQKDIKPLEECDIWAKLN